MLIRTFLGGACFAIALSLATSAGAAGLFDFGRNSAPQVDPQQVQDMEMRLESLEATVTSLNAQVSQLTAEVNQLQDVLKAVGVGPVPSALAAAVPPASSTSVASLPQLPGNHAVSPRRLALQFSLRP